nr:hypothetical protein [Tanacetum cinerariifolium]
MHVPIELEKDGQTIYDQIRTRIDYIHTTKAKLGINLDIPLSELDPLGKLNDLPNKKKKHADDIHDYFKANKRLKSSVQYEDHLAGIVLNEPVIEGEHIKKDKGKKALSSEEAEKESTDSDSNDETYMTGSMVESSRIKNVKKFDFITEYGKHIHLTEEQINQQKKIKEEAKAKAVKNESDVRKEELVNILSPEVVNKYYNGKL